MTRKLPHEGTPIEELDTPSLLIDLDAFERNLDRMADFLKRSSIGLRPHAKTHKCSTIAFEQIGRGAIGVCCQTVGEAEAMVAAGVRSVLITNQLITPAKIARLLPLAKQAEVMVCVDQAPNVNDLNRAALADGLTLPLLVEVDIGQHRCGVDPGMPTLDLVRHILEQPGLRFRGLHAYQGLAQHLYDEKSRRLAMNVAIEHARVTVALLQSHGISCPIVSGAGTGTFPFEVASGVYTEIQAGSYIFMDADYQRVEGESAGFENALFLLSTVIHRRGTAAVCDAGLKASSTDSGLPVVHERHDVEYIGASDEHGTLQLDPASPLKVGDQIWLIPGHCDPSVNLHDQFICVRNGHVEAVWPIEARGSF